MANCTVVDWPGSVPPTVAFELLSPGTIEASWDGTCNDATLPGQQYSVQVGDLDTLHASGVYTHAPFGDLCNLASPAPFTHGSGNEYYLVLPNEGGREGGGGPTSTGESRPATSTVCGEPREAVCP